jgi:hypothetical protein
MNTTSIPSSDSAVVAAPVRREGRARWAAIGAAIAVSVGAGGLMSASAAPISSGERATYVPINPCRVMDTRQAPETKGPRNSPLQANETHTITVWGLQGDCNIPDDAVGVVMNVAAVNPTASSFLTVYPGGSALPLAANLNWVAGQPPLSNAVTADLSATGTLSFYNKFGSVNVAADIVGYYVNHNHDDRYYTKGQVQNLQAYAQIQVAGASSLVAARTNGFSGVTRVGVGHYCVTLNADTAYDVQDVAAVATVEYGNSTGVGFVEVRGASACADIHKQFDVYTYDATGALSNQIAFNLVVPIHVDPLILIPGIEVGDLPVIEI